MVNWVLIVLCFLIFMELDLDCLNCRILVNSLGDFSIHYSFGRSLLCLNFRFPVLALTF
jgi:hypothetical protein